MGKTRAEVNGHLPYRTESDPKDRAAYVIAHALRQAQRGRKPSVAFNGITNPQIALEAAMRVEKAKTVEEIEPGKNLVVCQEWDWISSLPGRDGVSLHLSFEDRRTFVVAYWEGMPDVPPAKYASPSAGAYLLAVSDEVLLILQESETEGGVRFRQAAHPTANLSTTVRPLPAAA
jgi:hypothetical protein